MKTLTPEEIREKYCFVLVRSIHEQMENEDVRNLFPLIVKLKVEGYRKEYPQNILPFDTSDFVASHMLLCEKGPFNSLTPVLGVKSVTLKKCDEHIINFPMLSMLQSKVDDTTRHQEIVKEIIDRYRTEGKEHKLAYNGSFTILPRMRENRELMKYLWEITFSLISNYYIEYEIEHVLAICSTKFHIDKKKTMVGWNYIQDNEAVLSSYSCHSLFGEDFIPMEFKNIPNGGFESSQKFKDMWDNKILFDLNPLSKIKKAA